MSGNNERTFIMLKPDAVHRGLVGEIIKRFEQKGYKLVAMKMMHVSTKVDCSGKRLIVCWKL
jgi:nucleoside diphosphate kinase